MKEGERKERCEDEGNGGEGEERKRGKRDTHRRLGLNSYSTVIIIIAI